MKKLVAEEISDLRVGGGEEDYRAFALRDFRFKSRKIMKKLIAEEISDLSFEI